MPPKSAYPKTPRPAFKPPRPIGAPAPERPPAPKSAPSARPVVSTAESQPASPVFPDPSSDDDNDVLGEHKDLDAPDEEVASSDYGASESIPPKLLAKLLHDHFQHGNTRITKEAMALFVKYVDTFAAEAIARAIAERREAVRGAAKSGLGDDFLQVEDLEKLAPQLLLDF